MFLWPGCKNMRSQCWENLSKKAERALMRWLSFFSPDVAPASGRECDWKTQLWTTVLCRLVPWPTASWFWRAAGGRLWAKRHCLWMPKVGHSLAKPQRFRSVPVCPCIPAKVCLRPDSSRQLLCYSEWFQIITVTHLEVCWAFRKVGEVKYLHSETEQN